MLLLRTCMKGRTYHLHLMSYDYLPRRMCISAASRNDQKIAKYDAADLSLFIDQLCGLKKPTPATSRGANFELEQRIQQKKKGSNLMSQPSTSQKVGVIRNNLSLERVSQLKK